MKANEMQVELAQSSLSVPQSAEKQNWVPLSFAESDFIPVMCAVVEFVFV